MTKILRVGKVATLFLAVPMLVKAQSQVKPQPGHGSDPSSGQNVAEKLLTDRTLGRRAEARGDLLTAQKLYQKTIKIAQQNKDMTTLTRAYLDYARVCELGATEDKSGVFDLDGAGRAYQEVIRNGTPTQKLLAENNLGALLLKQGKTDEALRVFKAMNGPPLFCAADAGKLCTSPFGSKNLAELPQGYIYSYNAGRAFEASGDMQTAASYYEKALLNHLDFVPAVQAAFRVQLHTQPAPIRDTENLAMRLIWSGHPELAMPQLHLALDAWNSDKEAQRLLGVLVRCYAEPLVDPVAFKTTEWPKLTHWRELAPNLGDAVDGVWLAYFGPLQSSFSESTARQLVPAWSGEDWRVKSYGLLLRKLGDYYRTQEPARALERYALAWSLDTEDWDAALYAADVLLDEGEEIDPGDTLLKQFLHSVKIENTVAYLQNDWLTVLRLHTVLGSIFVRQQKWGSEDDPGSALYQFRHALDAERHYRKENSKFPPSPGLHEQLAEVYVHVDRRMDAWDEFTEASAEYLKNTRSQEARHMLDRAKSLNVILDPSRLERYAGLDSVVKKSLDRRSEGVA